MSWKFRRRREFIWLSITVGLAAFVLPIATRAGERVPEPRLSATSGNLALLVPVDSTDGQERAELDRTVLAALSHFGMPFDLLDLSKEKLTQEVLLGHSAIVIGQADLGKHLSTSDIMAIERAVKRGVGCINMGGSLSTYPAAYLRMLGIRLTTTARATSARVTNAAHPITAGKEPGRTYDFAQPVELDAIKEPQGAAVLLRADQALPAAFAARLGKGRIVQFTLSPKLWLPDYFGHVHGLDGVFWKSIAWAARKPFVMLAMPPFVTARVDDASGSSSRHLVNDDSAAKSFRYIESLNRFGYRPNVGLFTDDIADGDGNILKQKFDQGLAEFSAHAWTETRFIYINRIRDGNRHTRMVEYSPDDLRQRFERLDRQFARWGIKPSKTVNSHCFSPGVNALPFLKERGETFVMFAGRFGDDYYDPRAFAWNPKPYGDPGFTCDYMPGHPDFFNVEAHPYKVSRDGKINDADIDILYGNTTFGKESSTNRLARAAQRGAEAIGLGLDSLFFGCLFAHEQRIASLTVAEWETVLSDIESRTSQQDRIFKSYDYISEYAKSRYDTRIVQAVLEPASQFIRVKVAGKATVPLNLYVFNGPGLEHRFHEIPPVQGEQAVRVDLGHQSVPGTGAARNPR